jgi:hypothetical protein
MRKNSLLYCLFFCCFIAACKKPYEPPAIQTNYAYLVVDGVINASPNGVSNITVSRTQKLSDTVSISHPENNAQVLIDGETGGSFSLTAQGNGSYQSSPLNLNAAVKYRLRIITSSGSTYQSAFMPVKQTPPIDSITWKQDNDITLYAHTHDPNNTTRYYRWDYVETWQYHSRLEAGIGIKNGLMFYLDSTNQQYNCWGTINSSNISVATSANLSQDVISYAPINKIVLNDEKMMVRYSINVRQYGLTQEAYQYWQILERNTQQTGTIFDPQPTQVQGNLTCVTHPEEPVIGFVSVSVVTEKRIFIDYKELNGWITRSIPDIDCGNFYIGQNPIDFRIYTYPDTAYAPQYFVTGGAIMMAKKDCLDCRRRGGTNIKPAFWK